MSHQLSEDQLSKLREEIRNTIREFTGTAAVAGYDTPFAFSSKDGKESNFVLASTLKEVGSAVKDITAKATDGDFPGGEIVRYSLKDKGVELAETNLSDDASKAVADAKQAILDGKVEVPEKP